MENNYRTLPLAGYGIWFLQPRWKLLEWFAHIQPQMGFETYEIPVPSLPPAVLINDPNNLEYVLKNTDLFVKGEFFRSRSWDLFADGILNADGELWQIQRKAGLRFLINSNLEYFIDSVLPPMFETMAARLDAAADSGAIIDLQQELLDLTTRFFGKVAYDMDISPSMPFSQAFDHASAVTNARFTNPFWRLHSILFGRSFRNSCTQVHSFGASVVQNAQAALSASAFPQASSSPTATAPSPTAPNLITSLLTHISSPTTVAAAATNYLSAGRDTTAQSLTWAFHALLSHPGTIPPLLSAIDAHHHSLPPKSSSTAPELPAALELPFSTLLPHPNAPLLPLHAAFAESLRLNPAVPFEIKETTRQTVLPDGTWLPKGAAVLWVPYAMGRNPLIWGEGAGEFRPERWLLHSPSTTSIPDRGSKRRGDRGDRGDRAHVELLTKSAFENPVFNGGPRMCVGKRLAETLGVWVLARMLEGWEMEEVGADGRVWRGGWEGRKVGESLTAPMEGGLRVRVRRRARGMMGGGAEGME
ncbi:MAG: hypothetical protein MMC23_005143 [Stictis urceolatum]|nr:hypothetical protein [Stictis urceolata]